MNPVFIRLTTDSWDWIYERIQPVITKSTRGVIAWDKGEIVAATIFDTWTVTSGQIHVIIENPMVLRHRYIEECMNYFFNDCNKEIMIGLTPSVNEKALKFNEHLGFEELFRIEDGVDFRIDMVVQELRKHNCRWINNGQARPARAA